MESLDNLVEDPADLLTDERDEAIKRQDPIYGLDLGQYIGDALRGLAARDPDAFRACCCELTEVQAHAVQALFH